MEFLHLIELAPRLTPLPAHRCPAAEEAEFRAGTTALRHPQRWDRYYHVPQHIMQLQVILRHWGILFYTVRT